MFTVIDTTAHAMGFLMYNLATSPDKQEILYKEICDIIGSPDNQVTETHLNQLKYLKAAMQESLRILPNALGTLRVLPVRMHIFIVSWHNSFILKGSHCSVWL